MLLIHTPVRLSTTSASPTKEARFESRRGRVTSLFRELWDRDSGLGKYEEPGGRVVSCPGLATSAGFDSGESVLTPLRSTERECYGGVGVREGNDGLPSRLSDSTCLNDSNCGTQLREVAANGLSMSESVYEGRLSIPEHEHTSPTFCVVLEGGYEERYRNSRIDCGPGTATYHAPGDVHANRFGEVGGRCLELKLGTGLFEDDIRVREALRGLSGSRLLVPRWTVFMLWKELLQGDDLTPRIVEEEIVSFLDELARLPGLRLGGSPPRWLERVRERLHYTFADPPSLAALATAAGVHRTHLARAFRSHYHCTVGEYIRLRRVSRATGALRDAAVPISRVAFAVGFADQSHMTRTFRDVVGITPARFRSMSSGIWNSRTSLQ